MTYQELYTALRTGRLSFNQFMDELQIIIDRSNNIAYLQGKSDLLKEITLP